MIFSFVIIVFSSSKDNAFMNYRAYTNLSMVKESYISKIIKTLWRLKIGMQRRSPLKLEPDMKQTVWE